MSTAQNLDKSVVDKLNGPQAKEAQAGIEVAIEGFKQRFLSNVPDISNRDVADCKLISDLSVRSALQQYGKNPQVTDLIMLTLSGQQRGWSALYASKIESGADMNVGEAVDIFKSQDMTKVLSFTQTKGPICSQIFQKAQIDGLANEAKKDG